MQIPSPQAGSKKHIRGLSKRIWILIIGCIIVIAAILALSAIGIIAQAWAIILGAIFTAITTVLGIIDFFRKKDEESPQPSGPITHINIFPPLPSLDPNLIYENIQLVKDIYEKLQQDDVTGLVLTGNPGIGKSTIAALVYQYAEKQRKEGAQRRFNAESLWLRVDDSTTISDLAYRMMSGLDKSIPGFNILPLLNQVLALINALDTTPEHESRLVVLDQFEYLLKKREETQEQVGVEELLDILNRRVFNNPNCRVIFTGKDALSEIDGYALDHVQEYHISSLGAVESLEFLKQIGVRELQAKNIAEEKRQELAGAISNYRGHALSLTLLASILRNNEDLSLSELLQDPKYTHLRVGNPSEHLLDYVYHQQLTPAQRRLLQAFSVFRQAVGLEAAKAALPSDDQASQDDLTILLGYRLLLKASQELYQLHPLVANFAQRQFAPGRDLENPHTLVAAHARVAEYYRQRRKGPLALGYLIEATWHYCRACLWLQAYELMEDEHLFARLSYRGRTAVLLELYELLLPLDKWRATTLQGAVVNNHLGEIYIMLEMYEKALTYIEKALVAFDVEQDITGRVYALSNLGLVYRVLGQERLFWVEVEQKALRASEDGRYASEQARIESRHRKECRDADGDLQEAQMYLKDAQQIVESEDYYMFIKADAVAARMVAAKIYHNLGHVYSSWLEHKLTKTYYTDALNIYRELGASVDEARILYDMGWTCTAIEPKERLNALEQARSIQIEVRDRKGEGATLDKLGRIYDEMGKMSEARKYYLQALRIEREVGDARGTAITLHNMGLLYFEVGSHPKTMIAFTQLSQSLFEDIHNPQNGRPPRKLAVLRAQFGEEVFDDLLEEVYPQMVPIVEEALQEGSLPVKTPRPSAFSFALPGRRKAAPAKHVSAADQQAADDAQPAKKEPESV